MKLFTIILLFAYFSFAAKFEGITESGIKPIELDIPQNVKSKNNAIKQSIDDKNIDSLIKFIIDTRFSAFNNLNKYGIAVSYYTPKTGIKSYQTGLNDIVSGGQMQEDMLFQIASISKMFLAATVYKLEEEGILNTDDRISKYLGDIPNVKNTLKIYQLLNHSTGAWDFLNQDIEQFIGFYIDPDNAPNSDEILQNLKPYNITTSNEYSNTNYLILGKIVEKATSKPLHQVIQEKILTPLNLTNTFNGRIDNKQSSAIMAQGWFYDNYWKTGITRLTDLDWTAIMEACFGLGDMISTPSDLVKFGKAWMETKILSDTSLAKMKQVRSISSSGQSFAHGCFHQVINGKDVYNHTGSLLGYSSALYVVPEDSLVIALTINSNNAAFAYFPNRLQTILNALFVNLYDLDFSQPINTGFYEVSVQNDLGENVIKSSYSHKLNITLRDISGLINSYPNLKFELKASNPNIQITKGELIDTFNLTGYSYLEESFEFKTNKISDENITFQLLIGDGAGTYVASETLVLPTENIENIAAKFSDKTYNFVHIPLPSSEVPADGITISAWIRFDDFVENVPYVIWTLGYSNILMALKTGDNIILVNQFTNEDGITSQYYSPIGTEYGEYFYLAYTYDNKGSYKIYIDGLPVEFIPGNTTTLTGKIADFYPQLISLSGFPNQADVNDVSNFIGAIDGFRIWVNVLTEEEIYSSYYYGCVFGVKDGSTIRFEFEDGITTICSSTGELDLTGNFHAAYTEGTWGDGAGSVKNSSDGIIFYPNPTNDKLIFENIGLPTKIEISNYMGKSENLEKFTYDGKNLIIDVNDLKTGVYVVILKFIDKNITKIFIKN